MKESLNNFIKNTNINIANGIPKLKANSKNILCECWWDAPLLLIRYRLEKVEEPQPKKGLFEIRSKDIEYIFTLGYS